MDFQTLGIPIFDALGAQIDLRRTHLRKRERHCARPSARGHRNDGRGASLSPPAPPPPPPTSLHHHGCLPPPWGSPRPCWTL